jgi:hypothetical protein
MIYEISTTDIPAAHAVGASEIIISADGTVALVRSETPIECIAFYEDSELSAITAESKWRQPCKDCEV